MGPDHAYFGQKDLQQLRIIQLLVQQLGIPVEIVACPIIREPDGLAMSSRNALLSEETRIEATRIFQSLERAKEMSIHEEIQEVRTRTAEYINESPLLRLEYFDIVNGQDLLPVDSLEEADTIYGCIAAFAGQVRLIDKMLFK